MGRIFGLTMCIALWTAAPATASADDETAKQRAAALHAEGGDHYSDGNYDEAIAAFEEAYRISQLPGILFNLAQAHRLRGDCREALRHYRRYLEASPESANRAAAERHIEDLRPCARDRGDSSARGLGDEEPDALDADQPQAADHVEPAAPAHADFDVESDRLSSGEKLGLGVGAAGLAAVGAGVVAGLSARSASSDLSGHLRQSDGEFDAEAQRLEASFYRRRGWSIGLLAGGAAATIAGGAIYMLAGGDEAGAERSLAIAPRAGGAVMLLSGRY